MTAPVPDETGEKRTLPPDSPFSPAFEGFQILLLAGAAGSAAAGVLDALDLPLPGIPPA